LYVQFGITVIEEPIKIQNCASGTKGHNSHVCNETLLCFIKNTATAYGIYYPFFAFASTPFPDKNEIECDDCIFYSQYGSEDGGVSKSPGQGIGAFSWIEPQQYKNDGIECTLFCFVICHHWFFYH
jgi:hypothetical protein